MNNFAQNQSKIFDGFYILVCIDGTGSKDWRIKDETNSNSNSYVKQFHDNFLPARGFRKYLDGPTKALSGSDCVSIASNALNFIDRSLGEVERLDKLCSIYDVAKINRHNHSIFSNSSSLYEDFEKKIRIVLIGHSRGGAIATYVANKLRFPVYFLGLYDAVNSSTTLPNTDVIKNVQCAYHALNGFTRSRISFLRTSRSSTVGCYEEKIFITSHGGVGGDPFPSEGLAGYVIGSDFLANRAYLFEKTEKNIELESRKANDWIIEKAQLWGLRFRG